MLGLIGVNAVLDGALSITKKLDFDKVGVKVLLLNVPVPKFGKVLFDVTAGISVTDLPKVKVGIVLAVEDMTFSEDTVLETADTTDTFFVGSVVPVVLMVKFVSFVSRILVATFNCAGNVVFGKTASDFASILGLDEGKPLGTIAAVDNGVVLTFVVVVEELRVAQLTGCVIGGVTVLMSSA